MYSLDTRYAFDTEYTDLQFHDKKPDDVRTSHRLTDEHEALSELVREGQIAALSRFTVQDPEQAARLCSELALDHPAAVIALLWHDTVRNALVRLLENPLRHDLPPDVWERATALLLESGLAPDKVTASRRIARRKSSDNHWNDKARAHKGFSWQPPNGNSKEFQRGQPFPYQQAHVDSLENRNGKINDAWCRHMAREVVTAFEQGSGHFKDFLSQVAQCRYPFNTLELEHRHHEHVRESRGRRVQFTPEHLGRILLRLFALMKPQERRGYLVSWALSNAGNDGHEMSVLLEKAADGMNKVWWYDPNLSGNAMHLRVLPEDLPRLGIKDFDALDYVDRSASVFSMDIRDASLAQAWAGQFIRQTNTARMASFVEGLANGTVHEMLAALESITDWRVFHLMHAEVRDALHWAVQWGHTAAIADLAQWLQETEVAQKGTEVSADEEDESPRDVELWTLTLQGESMLELLARLEDACVRTDAARAYLELLKGAARHMDKASKRALYRSLDAFQHKQSCCIRQVHSPGYSTLAKDAVFRMEFEQLMARLKFW